MPASALASSGKSVAISVSNGTNRATLIEQYISPDRQLDSSQGSHQFLSNGNHLLGLGSYPYINEQTSTGMTVWYANWGPLPLQSYRAYKFPWIGKPPISEIALFAYAQNCSAPTAFYASWNGATQVESWKYFTSSSVNGTFTLAATAINNGTFETFAIGGFNLNSYAIAYDSLGNMLGQTPTIATFVPNAALAPNCNAISCPPGTSYSASAASTCPAPRVTAKSSAVSSTSSKFSSTSKASTSAKTTTTSPARLFSLASSPSGSTPAKTMKTKPSSFSLKPQVSSKPAGSTSPPVRPVSSTKTPPSNPQVSLKPMPSTSPIVRPASSKKPSPSKSQLTSKPTRSTSPIVRPRSTTKPVPSKSQATSKIAQTTTPPIRPRASTSTPTKPTKTSKYSRSKSHAQKPVVSPTPKPSRSTRTNHTRTPKPGTSLIKYPATSKPSRYHTTPVRHIRTSRTSTPHSFPIKYPVTTKPSSIHTTPMKHEETSTSHRHQTSPVIYLMTSKPSSSSTHTGRHKPPTLSFTKVRRPTSSVPSPTPTSS